MPVCLLIFQQCPTFAVLTQQFPAAEGEGEGRGQCLVLTVTGIHLLRAGLQMESPVPFFFQLRIFRVMMPSLISTVWGSQRVN